MDNSDDGKVIHATFGAKKPDQVLQCTECGCQKFFLHFRAPNKVGDVECQSCGRFLNHYCWGDRD
jgi:hypothetical protein